MGQCSLPSLVAEPKNKKNVLRNDVIGQLSELGLKWSGDNVSSAGETLIRSLTNCLRHIDGQHEVFTPSVNFVQTRHQLQRESEQSVPPVHFFVHVCLCIHQVFLCMFCVKWSVLTIHVLCVLCIMKSVPTGFTSCVS